MNSATNTAAALVPANDVAQAKRARKTAKAPIVHTDIRSRDFVRYGRKYEGKADKGHHVIVRPGVSVTVLGEGERVSGLRVYRTTFRVGDVAVYGGYNLTYLGTVVSIGEKVIKIRETHGTRVHALSLSDFSHENRYYDLAEIQKSNAAWSD